MGRSAASCFKIIACGSESVDRNDRDAHPENKGSDGRGWSFRKRSARHRVLSNTVITETPSSGNKGSPDSAPDHSQAPANSHISEKTSETRWTSEVPQLSISEAAVAASTSMTEATTTSDDPSPDIFLNEPVIIVIQAAIRGYLAQRALIRSKNVIKLQAAVRGHLVRRHALGTLRVVQAIIKMQNLVRARQRHLSLDGFKGQQNSGTKEHPTYVSIETLLSNRFAHQLLESTPRTKQINIKCDPSRSDSAWKWLERWMAVSSTEEQYLKPELSTELHELDTVKCSENLAETVIPSKDEFGSINAKSAAGAAVSFDGKENLTNPGQVSTLAGHGLKQPQPVDMGIFLPKQSSDLDFITPSEPGSVTGKLESETEQPKQSMKRLGSRKVSNPAFIATQSKFEELTLTNSLLKSIKSSNQELGIGSSADTVPSDQNYAIIPSVADSTEIPFSHNSRVQVGSECGTELSITSTLDSPDESEAGNVEIEAKVSEENVDTLKSNDWNIDDQLQLSDLAKSNEGIDAETEAFKAAVRTDITEAGHKFEETASNAQIELEPETGHVVYKSSPEASLRSPVTVPESQGTPSSQVSTNTQKPARDRKKSSPNHKSLSAHKKSPINPNVESVLRSSLEHLPKGHTSGKRRNSFGSPRADHGDQEPRDSTCSNSLPSYMQATESARAKAHFSVSPRSSPDVEDKDIYAKKRHSLPGSNGRQGSPHIQRSMSQAQQNTKGNGTHERKWQR